MVMKLKVERGQIGLTLELNLVSLWVHRINTSYSPAESFEAASSASRPCVSTPSRQPSPHHKAHSSMSLYEAIDPGMRSGGRKGVEDVQRLCVNQTVPEDDGSEANSCFNFDRNYTLISRIPKLFEMFQG